MPDGDQPDTAAGTIAVSDPAATAATTLEQGLTHAQEIAEAGALDAALEVWAALRRRFPDQRSVPVAAARALRLAGRLDDVEFWLAAARDRFPDDIGLGIDHAWNAYHRRALPDAIQRWRDIRARFPSHPASSVGLAVALRDDGRADEAESLLTESRAQFPGDASIAIEHARLAQRRRDWEEAIRRWAEFRAGFPDRSVGYTGEAECLRAAGRPAEAAALMVAAAERFPDDPAIAVQTMMLAYHERRWPEVALRSAALRQRFPDNRDGYLIGARALQALSRSDEAAALLAEAERRWPGERNVLQTAANLAFDRGDRESCIRIGQELVRRFPGEAAGLFHIARSLRDTGRASEAEPLLRDVFTDFPRESDLLSIWASLAMTRSDWPEAVRRWGLLRERFAGEAKFFWQSANALWRLGRNDEADGILEQASARFPSDPMVQSMWVEGALRRRNWQEAAQRAETVRKRLPDQALGYTLGVRALRESGESALADALLAEARRRLPRDNRLRRAEAEQAAARRDWAGAIRLWREVREAEPDDPAGYLGEAGVLRDDGRHDEADMLLRDGMRRFANVVAVHAMHAALAQQRGDAQEAVRRWEEVRRRFPESEAGYLRGAQALRDSGRIEDAEALLAEAVTRFPGEPEMVVQSARLAAARSDRELAIQRFREAIDRFPSRVDAVAGLVETLHQAGRHDEADAVVTEALQRFPQDATIAAAHATAAMQRQDWPEALRRWTDVAQRFPADGRVAARIFEVRLRLAEMDGEGAPAAPASGEGADSADMKSLVGQFESLGGAGHGCEFGLFQRAFGAEPLGLLRWADLGHDLLARALETEFEGVGEEQHTELFAPPGARPEYWTRDRRYWMAMRCFIPADQVPFDRMFKQACRRLQFLRRKLVEDLRSGDKIFVFKCLQRNLTDSEVARLHKAVRRYGTNTLLYVRYEDEAHPHGTVRVAASGLMVGYIDRFAFSPANENLGSANESWARVCREAHRLWQAGATELAAAVPALPPGPVVPVKWSAQRLDRLHAEVSRHAPDSREYGFAQIQLDVAAGKTGSARRRLVDLLERFARMYPHDGYTFEAAVVSAVLASQWDLVAQFLNDRFGVAWCASATPISLPGAAQTVRWEIDADGRSHFGFPIEAIEHDRVWEMLVQFPRTVSLFHDYSASSHPEIGQVLVSLGDSGSAPGLSFCDHRPGHFLIPDMIFLNTNAYAALRRDIDAALVPWEQREATAFWRGATTGQNQNRGGWRSLQRVRLCLIAQEDTAGLIDAGITAIMGVPPDFARAIETAGIRKDFVKPVEFIKYKFQIDLDGNTSPWSNFFQKLYTGSPVLKVASPTGYRQWYYDRLRPWWNYVPVAADMADLLDKIAWLKAHDDRARRIGERGRELAVSLTHDGELRRARRTITAAIRHSAGDPGTHIRFDREDADAPFLIAGWSEIERGGRWARGPEAGIEVLRPVTEGDLLLRLRVAPGVTGQRLAIAADGLLCHEGRVEAPGVIECRVPAGRRFAHDTLAITLLLPDACAGDALPDCPDQSGLLVSELWLAPAEG